MSTIDDNHGFAPTPFGNGAEERKGGEGRSVRRYPDLEYLESKPERIEVSTGRLDQVVDAMSFRPVANVLGSAVMVWTVASEQNVLLLSR